MQRERFWYGFVVPWIAFALLWADFGQRWNLEGSYSGRLLVGLVGGFVAVGPGYVLKPLIIGPAIRWLARRKQVPPAA